MRFLMAALAATGWIHLKAAAAGPAATHWPSLAYSEFIPSRITDVSPRPLVVALHGCDQNAADFAAGTELNALAQEEKFHVLYVEQSRTRNNLGCWNWFDAKNHERHPASEAALIIGAINEFADRHASVDKSKIYVMGLSAGAAMTHILISCYPDTFAGAAIFAGLPFAAATNAVDAFKLMTGTLPVSASTTAARAHACSGQARKAVPTFILHGSADRKVVPSNATAIENQLLVLADLKDDGLENKSVAFETRATCDSTWSEHQCREVSVGGEVLVKSLLIKDLGHAWSGTRGLLPHTETRGPKATELIWKFFKN